MRFLVTGAAGFVGRALVARLQTEGEVRAAVRSPVPLPGVEVFPLGDIGPSTRWADCLEGVDVVVHLAGRAHVLGKDAAADMEVFRRVNVSGSESLARAALRAGVRRLVFVSTVGVLGRSTPPGEALNDASPPRPMGAYAATKWEAEESLRRLLTGTGVELTILRPPLVYGPRAPGNFGRLARLVASGLPLPLASIRNRRSFISLENLCDALALACVHPAAAGRTFLVADGEDVSTPELVRGMAAALGRSPRLFPVPPELFRWICRAVGRVELAERLADSLVLDSSLIRRTLDWRPPCSLAEGLRRSLAKTDLV